MSTRQINFDRLKPLTRDQLELIHSKTIDVLGNTGMWICSERARNIFKKHGFKVKGETVYYTGKQIEDALRTVPSQFTVKARNPKNDITIGGEEGFVFTNGGGTYHMDYQGNLGGNSHDFINYLKINQTLDAINTSRVGFVIEDIPDENMHMYGTLSQIRMTDKVVTCGGPVMDLLSILFGISEEKMRDEAGKKIGYALSTINPRSPLALEESQCENCIELSTSGIPFDISPMPLAGMSAPVSIPGLLIVANAEILGSMVLSQLVNPGAMVMYGILGTVTNMKTQVAPTAAPEVGIINKAGAQLAAFYGMPARGDVGLSDSNCTEFQAGAESAFVFVNAIRSGVHFMTGLGTLGSRNIISLEKTVLDAELVGYVKRMIRPMEFTDESMAVEIIKKVGHKNSYIAEEHTYDHFRTEIYNPMIFVQQSVQKWESEGRKDAFAGAHEKVQEILDNYEQPVLEKSIEKDLDKYAKDNYPVAM